MAAELGVSRNTVTLVLDQLRAEGYVEGQMRAGTFVSRTLPDALLQAGATASRRHGRSARPELSLRGKVLVGIGYVGGALGRPRPFRPGVAGLGDFPAALWARLAARRWRTGRVALGYGDPAGFLPLRQAIADYVGRARGARCGADQVLIVSGSQQGLDLAARVLLDPGDVAWIEEPGYLGARAALLAAGAVLAPVPVDRHGIDVGAGERRAPEARLAYVSPSHQFPLGVTLSATRRLELLRWARKARAWVLEDDYDSEYRYASRPLASLQGLDEDGRVVYIGTFSKTLFPGLRLGYVIAPTGTEGAFQAARAAADRHSPSLEQAVLADFIGEGHFVRHVRRMRALYLERRDALRSALARRLDGMLELGPAEAGMHVLGWLAAGVDDARASAALAEAGVEAPPLSRYALRPLQRGGLLLGYAGFSDRALQAAVDRAAPVLERIRSSE
jgi:GntR family transcriptional regulator/MocR family aminotransferase